MQTSEYQRLHEAEDRLWWFRALHLFLRLLLPKTAGSSLALDIGCGTGGLLRRLAAWQVSPHGVDFSAAALQFARHRQAVPLAQASANALPFTTGAFDLVTCIDVLEVATVDPAALVRNALRVLRPGGYGLFVMAAHQWLLSEHDRAVNSVRRFNLGQMRSLFSAEAVTIRRASYLFFLLFPVVALRKLLNRPQQGGQSSSDVSVPPMFINQPLYWLCWLEAQWLRVFNLPIGSSVMILVQKNA
jgi:SAM-dependent methyltransferase